ncbi:G-type lectin S-receptor-like serine/threonine-protein kinase At5g24080 isoform X1 [Lycium ferocissimum]|uniref:G-type lectin S-receptor-like serine/threonine-protein kinase At5g24080 isoform X1 n=1 Tax=Lycium ferocissimum TaxID=112874 RepID=UPI002814FD1E|nr:G-type lectin S-receptor-like serine/threonine-protein kinase At5g24080 isoform X1 [Lycium ferocissimum]
MAPILLSSAFALLLLFVIELHGSTVSARVIMGSRLLAKENQSWFSDNGTFAFGFTPTVDSNDQYQLAIWFAQLPGDRTLVWSPNINSPVSKDAILEFDTTGNLLLMDGDTAVWTSNTSEAGVELAVMSENGNFILYSTNLSMAWQSFSHPSDTLLPGQSLAVSLELTSSKSPSHGGYYTLKMLQQPTSLSLALTYNVPNKSYDSSPEFYSNFSYWSGPEISNVTGDVIAVLDKAGSFGIIYGSSSDGAVYVYKNDDDYGGLSSAVNQTNSYVSSVLRRLTLEVNGNLRLYRWDNDMNGSRQWVPEWAAVSNPCDISGICGNGICNLDRSKTNASCTCLPGTSKVGNNDVSCSGNSLLTGKCGPRHENLTSQFKISTVQKTNYYFSESSVIGNYSDRGTVTKCGDACLSNCDCVASVYGLSEEKAYCWLLRSLEFGGFEDPVSTLFVKVEANASVSGASGNRTPGNSSDESESGHDKVLILPIVLSMIVLIGLLCCLLYINIHRKRSLNRAFEGSLLLSGAPISFSYRDLQCWTNNFSELLGTGGFGSVYKGSLKDGTLIAVKKLDKISRHGEKEFITEVKTIGSMHHLNLVRLCGYCSEGTQRLLVYEYMKNGSLDKWIFHSISTRNRLLDWASRFRIAVDTAQGIAYFHEQCRNRIIHCDIKPENILLDENFCPKVSDFGLAKLMGREHSHVVTMIRGTRGYLAPEWVSNRPITVKADVYSYGMLLLEIIGGRRNLDMTCDADDFFYPGWAYKEMTSGTPVKVVDRRLRGVVEEKEVLRALMVAFWCIQDEVSNRPSMGEVVKMLEGSVDMNMPPMPQTVLQLIEEGLDQVYKATKRELNQYSSFSIATHPSSYATCSHSTMSPR